MKKKIIRIIFTSLFIFLIYIGLNMYQSNNIEIISFNDMNELRVSANDIISEDTTITGTADIGPFESVAMTNRIVVEDTLYLIIYKWPTLLNGSEIDFNFENDSGLSEVNKITVVWGDIYSDEGTARGVSHHDLIDHPDQQIIWEKMGGEIE